MGYYCSPCDKWFNTPNGLNQHIENSAAHSSENWECDQCDRVLSSEYALHQHCANSSDHPYCVSCKRLFGNENNLMQHMHSRVHVGDQMSCPFCKRSYPTASAVTIHLETGKCSSGLNREKINAIVQRMDTRNVITRPMLTTPGYDGYDRVETIATDRAWNGSGFQCYFCTKEYNTLRSLNQHIQSPAHEQNIYRCPKSSCGRTYKLLSGLVQHVESESCGVMRFMQVQQQAMNGIQNMVGRMIQG